MANRLGFSFTTLGLSRIPWLLSLFLLVLPIQRLAAAQCSANFSLPANQWQQINLPCDPGAANSVADVLGDDMNGVYGQDWAIFGYDAAQSRYTNLGESGLLVAGLAYWIIQLGETESALEMHGNTLPTFSSTEFSQCPLNPGRCSEVALTHLDDVTWNLIGGSLISRIDWQQARVVSASGACADNDGCSVTEAATASIMHDQLWHYAGEEGYRVIENHAAVNPWEGFWAATLENADQVKLILPVAYGGYQPEDQSIAAFDSVSATAWNETAVRKVLHRFAFGGQARAEQIEAWSNLTPQQAIIEMLSFDEFNPLLSPPALSDSANLGEKGGSLKALGQFWSSAAADNDVDENDRARYDVSNSAAAVRPNRLWERAVMSRGVNPFRQKIGLWESNYHLATNLAAAVTDRQMLRYYDDILGTLAISQASYADTLTNAATSAAIAKQYGHDKNIFRNGECECNEDFAREYHQLFFGILGASETEYHENITIKNTARVLTDMRIFNNPESNRADDQVTFGTAQHWPGDLEIHHAMIGGVRANERIATLSNLAIEHPESLQSLPVMIVRGLADDNPGNADLDEIRTVWNNMGNKNLLHFLRGYAISKQFHDSSRVKYLNSFDRNVSIFSQTILNNFEINVYDFSIRAFDRENASLFYPKHNVFGGQTGREASTSSNIFRLNYNRSTERHFDLYRSSNTEHNWKKDWATAIPKVYTDNHQVDKVGEFLWNRYIGDGLKNYGVLERSYVNAFLATDQDWQMEVDESQLNRVFTTSELTTDAGLIALREAHASAVMALTDGDEAIRQTANKRVGRAINFITATPFVFAQQGQSSL